MKKYHSPKEYLDAAKSGETPLEELDFLSKSEYPFARSAVARNINTTSEILKHLIPDEVKNYIDQDLVLAISENQNASEETLEMILKLIKPLLDNGRDHQVAFAAGISICNNTQTPLKEVINVLNNRVSTEFKKVLARMTSRTEILKILVNDKSEKVRRKAENRINELSK